MLQLQGFSHKGHWRSWLARFHGMEEVIGSNPICSTRYVNQPQRITRCGFCLS